MFSFIGSVERIYQRDYVPSIEDIMRCRIPTTGVSEVRFGMKGMMFRFQTLIQNCDIRPAEQHFCSDYYRVVDVGGQRSERRKWIQCFGDVNSIIFVASLSDYDQNLYEDCDSVMHSALRSSLLNFWGLLDTVKTRG